MRTLFIAVSKVCGLFQLYSGLNTVFTIAPLLYAFRQAPSGEGAAVSLHSVYGSSISFTATSFIIMILLSFGFAWLLIFRAAWLADKLNIPEQNDRSHLSGDAILGVGARLLGLFVIIQAAPDLIGKLSSTISGVQQLMSVRDLMGSGIMWRTVSSVIWSSIVPPALKLALGLLLVLKTETVLKWMNRRREMTEPSAAPLPSEGAPSEGR